MLNLMRIKTDSKEDNNKNQEHSPLFHMVMLFVQASGRAYFFDKIHWIMRHNPNLRKVTYSHLSLYYAEFVCVAHRDLEALERQGFLTTLTLSGIDEP